MVTHSLVVCCSIFFFNDTATTESYTYVHTPSTTLFRSISEGWSRARQPGSSGRVGPTATCGGARPSAHQDLVSSSRTGCCQPPARGGRSCRTPRSEEHTSELQSLMRISDAVSSLKNKKLTLDVTHRQRSR